MQYLVAFLEGIITFISPCLLPMLPIYVSYFAGGDEGDEKTGKTLTNAIGFVLGFTIVFTAMGAFAGTIGAFLREYSTIVNIVAGGVIVLFGLNFLGIIKFNFFKGSNINANTDNLKFFSSMLFGMVFSVGWTPCVGVFLGSALVMASQRGTVIEGVLMLVLYSMGLGIPFVLSAVLIEKLKTAFDFIKKHYRQINIISGTLLIIVGIAMMTGFMGKLLTLFS